MKSAVLLLLAGILFSPFAVAGGSIADPAGEYSVKKEKPKQIAAKNNKKKKKAKQPIPQPQEDSRPVVLADETRITDDGMHYDGHVEVSWKSYRIFADSVKYQQKQRTLIVTGRVTLTSKESVISGSKLVFNLDDQTGVMEDAQGLMPPSVSYLADYLRMTDKETMRFDRMTFTSCNQRVPRWQIRCRKGKIVKERYIDMKAVTLRVKKIPVMFLPYMRYPLDPDGRATGFLFPQVGNSSQRGFFIQNAFFWDIRPNIDFTLNVDYFSKVGWGFGPELRYLFPSLSGRAHVYWMKFKPGDAADTENRSDYYIDMDNQINLGFLNSRLVLKADHPSDPNFLRLFNNNFDTVLQTRFGYSLHWSSSYRNITFSAQASRNETYYTFNNSSRVLKTMPGIDLNLNQQELGPLPGTISLRFSLESIARSGITYEGEPVYATDVTSRRINVVPRYTLNLLKLPWFTTTVNLESRHNFYDKSLDPANRKVVDESLHLYYNQAQVSLKGPGFFRVFSAERFRLKHLIEPEVMFRYVDQVDPDDLERLIRVDNYDFPPFSSLTFSLSHSLLLKKRDSDDSAREIFRHTISQHYYLDEAEANKFLQIDGEYPKFSELENQVRFRPVEGLSLDFRAAYNHYIRDFRNFDVSLSFKDPREQVFGAVTFSYSKNPYMVSNYVFNRTVVRGSFGFDFPDFPLKLRSALDYDFTLNKFRYGSIMLFYDYQCIRFQGEFKVFLRGAENDFQLRFGVSLGNMGMVSELMSRPTE